MHKSNAIRLLILALLAWKVVRTDWIVSTNYWYFDADLPPSESTEVRTYTPPVTPLWRPPRPQDIEPTATTWRHMEFFYMGGAGGPTEEPKLHINWTLLLLKLAFGMIAGLLFILVAFRLFSVKHNRPEPTTGHDIP